ncbi:MAG: hypothetical protein A3E87_01490 [Gammaproteobacteria bacterium RIFCSPHIGHO2_12_FULL_35_23]|nr:MAG: hypothetical protein A3E87_01490 [Gammaproteobacteria bacterium RIFCSPHIGHO2_12_FULL_35_23]
MARSIKKIAHDLIPLSDAVTELSSIISQLLEAVKPYAQFENSKASQYFDECAKASQKLAISSKLIREYVQEVNNEADREGISKN